MRDVKISEIASISGRKDVAVLVDRFANRIGRFTVKDLQNKRMFAATTGDTLVGLTGYRHISPWLAEQVHTIVLPSYRNNGYGHTISSRLAEIVLSKYGKVYCTVNEENIAMVKIKEAQGFSREGVLKDHYAPGRNIILFSKRRD